MGPIGELAGLEATRTLGCGMRLLLRVFFRAARERGGLESGVAELGGSRCCGGGGVEVAGQEDNREVARFVNGGVEYEFKGVVLWFNGLPFEIAGAGIPVWREEVGIGVDDLRHGGGLIAESGTTVEVFQRGLLRDAGGSRNFWAPGGVEVTEGHRESEDGVMGRFVSSAPNLFDRGLRETRFS